MLLLKHWGCCPSCQKHLCLACAPGVYVSTGMVEHGKQFQPKRRGNGCFQPFLKNSTCLFKLCPSSAPVWFLLPGQLSSVASSGLTKNRHVERKYSSGRATSLFSNKRKSKKETALLEHICHQLLLGEVRRRSHLVSVKAHCFMVSVITAPLTNAPLKKKRTKG